MDKLKRKLYIIKAAVVFLEITAFLLLAYLVTLPFYPALKYKMSGLSSPEAAVFAQDIEVVQSQTREIVNSLPQAAFDISPNRLIISKIGVNAPVVQAQSADYGLSRGAWHVPDTSTPDKGGNTVITGHRFKYLPPSNLTFYLFHKLEVGDLVSVIWEEKEYYYRIRETRIIEPTEVSILNPSAEPILTLFTCHPIYSTDKRLVIIADLI